MAHVCPRCGTTMSGTQRSCHCSTQGARDPFAQGVSTWRRTLPSPPSLMPRPGSDRPRWLVPALSVLGGLAVLAGALAVAVVLQRVDRGGGASAGPVASATPGAVSPGADPGASVRPPTASSPPRLAPVTPRPAGIHIPAETRARPAAVSPSVPSAASQVRPRRERRPPAAHRRSRRPRHGRISPPRAAPPPATRATPYPHPAPMSVEQMLKKLAQRKPAASQAVRAVLPARLSRSAIRRGVYRVVASARACARRTGKRGLVTVKVTVSGATGAVTRARVTGPHASTPLGRCVARSFRSVRFPRFGQAHQSFTAPLVLR